MRLFPKARPVRIKLLVGEEEHSSLSSLRDNFDVEVILSLRENGGLHNWLRQINEERMWDKMKQLDGQPLIQKYLTTFDIFFSDGKLSLEERLLSLQSQHYKSFQKLLKLVLINPEFSLSINTLESLFNKALEKGDGEMAGLLSRYVYNDVNKILTKICYIYPGYTKVQKCDILTWIKQLACRWNISIQNTLETDPVEALIDLRNIVDRINLSKLISNSQLTLPDLRSLNSIKSLYRLNGHECLVFDIEMRHIKECVAGMINADIEIKTNDQRTYITLKINGESFFFVNHDWYGICSQIKNINSITYVKQLEAWKRSIVRMFIIALILKGSDLQLDAYRQRAKSNKGFMGFLNLILFSKEHQIRNFFNNYGGIDELPAELRRINTIINSSSLNNYQGIQKFIFQTILFVGVLAFDRNDQILSLLLLTDYRPAKLLAGKVKPVYELEREFMERNDVGRIQLLIENNFNLSYDRNSD